MNSNEETKATMNAQKIFYLSSVLYKLNLFYISNMKRTNNLDIKQIEMLEEMKKSLNYVANILAFHILNKLQKCSKRTQIKMLYSSYLIFYALAEEDEERKKYKRLINQTQTEMLKGIYYRKRKKKFSTKNIYTTHTCKENAA